MKNTNKKVKYYNPYKVNAKEFVVVIFSCFLIVTALAYGMSYLERYLVSQEVIAVGNQLVTFSEYVQTNYLGQFGKTYTVGLGSFENQYDFDTQDLLTYYLN